MHSEQKEKARTNVICFPYDDVIYMKSFKEIYMTD